MRKPFFCSGCPHNTSTKVPEGSRAVAGIGCHYMAIDMQRHTDTFTQMGGEGVPWIGQAHFTTEKHVFANLGDGTYYHSGLLAIRASLAAKVNITYKILYNDAVAMTGGQPVEGGLSVPEITRQLHGEGVTRILVVSDEPDKYPPGADFAAGVEIRHRDDLDQIQRELRETPGCTVLVYDQTCAAEKRRRRKRGTFPDPDKRAFINEAVCEGCGDCQTASNCISVEPAETEFGRKRQINQSSCNKDFSCVNGFCPSFVTLSGAKLRQAAADGGAKAAGSGDLPQAPLPLPELPALDQPYSILVTGVGGTGVITIGALIGMAAHLEGKGVTVLDMTGLAQKGGAVLSHIRLASKPEEIHAVRISAGGAEAVIGCDLVVSAGTEALTRMAKGATKAVINSHLLPTADFVLNPDASFHEKALRQALLRSTGDNLCEFVAATEVATALMGDAIATNIFMLGYAFQRGLIPLGLDALLRAIELNGIAVKTGKRTFAWGRLMAYDPKAVEALIRRAQPKALEPPAVAQSLDDILALRMRELTLYQNAAYAGRYEDLVRRTLTVEHARAPGCSGLAEAVARYAFKLMAYKDEYEVARLYTDGRFQASLKERFEGDVKLTFHLAPPLFASRDPVTGALKKRPYGPWIFPLFKLLARLKGLRGTPLDPFGRTAERRLERQLIADYFALMAEILAGLNAGNHALAVALAAIPEQIRGYGHVKDRHIAAAKAQEASLLARFRLGGAPEAHAAE